MRYAIVENGVVTSILRGAAPVGTVQIPDGVYVSIGYLYNGSTFSEPPPPTAEQLEAEGEDALNNGTSDPAKLFKLIKAVALWQAQLHGKTAAQARDEVAAVYKAL